MAFVALGAAFLALSLIAPINHDESQYVAAAELARTLHPFIDFLYLQTPLQPYLTAPVAALSDHYSFVSLRLVMAFAGVATILVVHACLRTVDVAPRLALAVSMLLALDHNFQFGATVVRNDALPALFAALGMWLGLIALRKEGGTALHWAAVGVAFAAAMAAKISYAVPAAAVGLFLMLRIIQAPAAQAWRNAAACAGGAAAIILPVLLFRSAAPVSFDYGVFSYGAQAPFDWYEMKGSAHKLTLLSKLRDTGEGLVEGTAWAALIIVIAVAARGDERQIRDGGVRLFLNLLVAAGLVAALLPTPTWPQYLIPLLPPLFVRMGLALANPLFEAPPWRRRSLALIAIAAAIGLVQPVVWVVSAHQGGHTAITLTNEAHWIGRRLRATGTTGEIATLSPHVVIDSGFPIDRRFATGPFLYRTGDAIPPRMQRMMNGVSPATLDRFLSERPPLAIVTGYEDGPALQDLDRGLREFALSSGYRLERSPFGEAELYLAPGHSGPPLARISAPMAQDH